MVVWTGFDWGTLSWQQHQSVQIAILLLIDDFNQGPIWDLKSSGAIT